MSSIMKPRKTLGISCDTCHVRELCLVKDINDHDIELLNENIFYAKIYSPGDFLYRAGTKVNKIFAVYSGLCKDFQYTEGNGMAINEFYLPGDILGLEFLNEEVYKFNAVAIKETYACIIPTEFIHSDKISANIRNRLFYILCGKINNQLYNKSSTNSRARIASFFYNLIRRSNMRPNQSIKIGMTYLDISNKIGIANETLSRILKEYNEADIIRIQGDKIVKADTEQLEKIINK